MLGRLSGPARLLAAGMGPGSFPLGSWNRLVSHLRVFVPAAAQVSSTALSRSSSFFILSLMNSIYFSSWEDLSAFPSGPETRFLQKSP